MPKANRIREGSRVADVIIYLVLAIICFVTLYPMYYVLILSISDPLEAAGMQVYLYPKGFYLNSYKILFKDMALWRSYWNTLVYVVSDTVLMLIVCTLCAYPLTSSRLIGRKAVTIFLLTVDQYRRNRDLCVICLVALYLVCMVDAYVDAQMAHFDVSPDLSLDLAPAVITPQNQSWRRTSLGMQWTLTF